MFSNRELNLVRVSAEAVAAGVRALVPTNVPFGVLQASPGLEIPDRVKGLGARPTTKKQQNVKNKIRQENKPNLAWCSGIEQTCRVVWCRALAFR